MDNGLAVLELFASLALVTSCTSESPAAPITYPNCGAAPSYWVQEGDAIGEHITFHLIVLRADGSPTWNGITLTRERLELKLREISNSAFSAVNQVGLEVEAGARCEDVEELRRLMSKALDCHGGMCRVGGLVEPPPPPP